MALFRLVRNAFSTTHSDSHEELPEPDNPVEPEPEPEVTAMAVDAPEAPEACAVEPQASRARLGIPGVGWFGSGGSVGQDER